MTGPQQARAACGNMFVASCGSILDIFSRTPSSTGSNSSAGDRIIFSVVAPRSAASPCRPISMNRSLVMIMPAPSHMSTICCICFCIAAGSAASQSSSRAGLGFSSAPGAAAASLHLSLVAWRRARHLWLHTAWGSWAPPARGL